jgi:hypothetical protein
MFGETRSHFLTICSPATACRVVQSTFVVFLDLQGHPVSRTNRGVRIRILSYLPEIYHLRPSLIYDTLFSQSLPKSYVAARCLRYSITAEYIGACPNNERRRRETFATSCFQDFYNLAMGRIYDHHCFDFQENSFFPRRARPTLASLRTIVRRQPRVVIETIVDITAQLLSHHRS